APAYKRFSSDIKVIHFIGQNKPWSHTLFRSSSSSPRAQCSIFTPDMGTEGSDAYSALLDRWFAVYDQHYRSAAVPIFSMAGELLPTPAFKETIYENVWDGGNFGLIVGATGGVLGLDKLRQLALEGLGRTPTSQKGEGAYMTLPLEGRISLMSKP
ncbi:glycosyltransferase family 8 protein, partial [Ramaria rubella]